MNKKILKKLFTYFSIGAILIQSVSPLSFLPKNFAYAEDIAPTEAPVLEETTTTTIPATTTTTIPELTITPTPEITNNEIAIPTISLDPQLSQPLSQWTFEKVELNKEYVAPQNSGVKLTFTKLPDPSGNIKIEEITLTEEQVEKTGALSNKAYDITSNMKDGEFSYTLSLPIPESSRGKEVEVKFAEELSKIEEAKKVENTLTKTDTSVSVSNLDHFTIFVVVNSTPSPINHIQNIIDNSDSGFEILSGIWRTSTSVSGYLGSNYITTDDHSGVGQVRWNFISTQTGDQEVFAHWTALANRGTAVPFTITHNVGTTTVSVNQELNNGTWVSLGVYPFTAGNSYSVTLTNNSLNTNDYVIGDAIKVQNVSDPSVIYIDDDWIGITSGTEVIVGSDNYYIGFNAFSNIQDGISAVAENGTINVAAGTYEEQVSVVGKNLTIVGNGIDSTFIKSPTSLNISFTTPANNRSIVYLNGGTVTIKNLTVDGFSRGNANYRMIGIGFYNGAGTVDGVKVTRIENFPADGSQSGNGIYAYNDDGTARSIIIKNSKIDLFQKNGITINGVGLTATVQDNDVDCYGVIDFIAQNGIQFGYGSTGTATGNNINGCSFINPSNPWNRASMGILLYNVDSGMSVTENTVTNNDNGIYASGFISGLTISSNIIQNNYWGVSIYDTTSGNPIAFNSNSFNNNTWDLDNYDSDNINAVTTTSWSVTDQENLDQIEAKINHYCSGSTYVHGVCSGTDDYSAGFGMVRYKDIGIPVNLGWNVKSKSPTPNETPLDLVCSTGTLYVNENSVAQNWSAVGGVSTKYQREVTYPSGSIGYFEAGSNNYTNFVTFGGASGIEGLWKTRVKAYVDVNNNNKYDSGEEDSTWSDYCNITFDETPPNTPSFISPENNTITNINAITLKWIDGDDSLSGVNGYTFRYDFYPANGGAVKHWSSGFVPGTQKTRSGTFGHGEGRYEMYVKITDNAGNVSLESNPLIITYDKTAPNIPTLDSPIDGFATKGVAFTQKWNSVNDAVLYEYQSCNVDPGDSGLNCPIANIKYGKTYPGTTKNVEAGQPDSHFWWRIRAKDSAENWSGWSESRELIIDNTEPSKTLITKPDIEEYFKTNSILNQWNPSIDVLSGIQKYQVWYAYDDNHSFSNSTCSVTVINGKEGRCRDVNAPATSRNHTPGTNEQGGVTIRVRAIDNAGNEGEWSDPVHYYYDATAPDAPKANPVGGIYYSDQTVELTAETDAVIKYTTDETDPINGTEYTGPITIGVDTKLKAIAIDKAGNVSPVMEEVYEIAPVISGETLKRLNDTSIVLNWTTDDPSTSRVVYDTKSHKVLGAGDNYGYAYTTGAYDEDPNKVKSHSVTITGLNVGTTYYFMPISHGSPEATGKEIAFTPYFIFGLPGDGLSDGGSDGKSDGGSTGGPSVATAGVLGASTLAYEGVGGIGGEEVLGAETEDEEKEEDKTIEETVNDSDVEKDVLGETTDVASSIWQNTFYRWLIIIIAVVVIATLLYFLFFKRKKNKETS